MRSHVYHWPGYPNFDDIPKHNQIEYPNAVAAEKAGYRAAKNSSLRGMGIELHLAP
jgi:hypothetical protein